MDIESTIASLPPGGSIGRPALADALVDAGHAAIGAMRSIGLLGEGRPAFVARTRCPAVHRGGKDSQRRRESRPRPSAADVDEDIPRFVAAGLGALERASDHCPDTEQWHCVISLRHLASS